ncbi:MAG: hypothetical protein GF317_13305 [Candidatus Lokiarchaeota archaeon]|nr:hypothetical protein [Candidatus Lokiarchaeota archaeon]MBD3200614.1 hypothetical protein [Candidatus Lokiarchaeota archaeon]
MRGSIYWRSLYIFGIICGLLSFIFDFYTFTGTNNSQEVIVNWSYNLLLGWYSSITSSNITNTQLKPYNEVAIIIPILLLISLISGLFISLFKDIEQQEEIQNYSIHSYILVFILFLIQFYILIFPIFYLLQEDLYFPIIIFYDAVLELNFFHSIGLGYILLILSFICTFPYILNYFLTVRNYEMDIYNPELVLNDKIKEENEEIDIDKMIAEENIRIGEYEFRKMQEEKIRERILRTGGI